MRHVADETLRAIQQHFHETIRGRAAEFSVGQELQLPEITHPLPAKEDYAFFTVPGMYGGFHYWLTGEGEQAKLICESWCRISGGSGQRHEITACGSELVEEGFM